MQRDDTKAGTLSLRKTGVTRTKKVLARFANKDDKEVQGQDKTLAPKPWDRAKTTKKGFKAGSAKSQVSGSGMSAGKSAPKAYPERQVINVHDIYPSEVPLGRMVSLEVSEITEQGAFINAKEHGALFVPKSQLPDNLEVGHSLRVFLYKDGERVLATGKRPYIELGMTGRLKVNSIENGTAYLDLGIPKELVVPISEQRGRFREGYDVLVLVAIDNLGRLFGSQCFNRYIREKARPQEFKAQDKVKVVAVSHTPLGYRVIVNDSVYGLIYESEQKGEITIGKRYDGFIKLVRPDGRLDVSLQESGRSGVEHAAQDILQALHYSHGELSFNDKSDPQDIEDYLHMSKARFKKAIGSLYKERLIEIKDNGIKLTAAGAALIEQKLSVAEHLKASEHNQNHTRALRGMSEYEEQALRDSNRIDDLAHECVD